MLCIIYPKYDHACCTLLQLNLKVVFYPLIRPEELLEGFFWPITVLYTVVYTEISTSREIYLG